MFIFKLHTSIRQSSSIVKSYYLSSRTLSYKTNSVRKIINSFSDNKLNRSKQFFSTTSSLLANKSNAKTNNWEDGKQKFVLIFSSGVLVYLLYTYVRNKPKSESISSGDNDQVDLTEKFGIDLNEIYEECAIAFLQNSQVRNALGLPIKITSHEADDVRQLQLTRHGETLYAFISYNLHGSHNSGHVYSKSKMDSVTKKFTSVEIILKLDKPYNGTREVVVKRDETKKESTASK